MIAIFDIDGTLSDATHRLHWIISKPKNWKAFFLGIPDDEVILPIASIMKDMSSAGHTIVIATARPEWTRAMSEHWFAKNGLDVHHHLFMRKERDYRPDTVVKPEIAADIARSVGFPDIWFDDKKEVVEVIRKQGIYTVHVG